MKLTYEMLVSYVLGELPANEAGAVEATVRQDRAAADSVKRLAAILSTMKTDDTVEPTPAAVRRALALHASAQRPAVAGWLDALRRVVAQLTFDSRTQAATAGFRSASAGFLLSYESEVGSIELQAEPAMGRDDRWRVVGQFGGSGAESFQVAACKPATFEPVGHSQVDEHGMFRLYVQRGTYTLLIAGREQVVILPDIRCE